MRLLRSELSRDKELEILDIYRSGFGYRMTGQICKVSPDAVRQIVKENTPQGFVDKVRCLKLKEKKD